MLHTDSFFAIGQKHVAAGKPCQDYAMSGEYGDGNLAFAIVSDGCSTGRNTDVGARLLVLSTAEAIREYWEYENLILPWMTKVVTAERMLSVKNAGALLGVTHQDMLATSIFACFTKSGGIVHVQGDGVIAVKYRDGRMQMTRFDWPNNIPFYPVYEKENLDAFIQAHGGDAKAEVVLAEEWSVAVEDGIPKSFKVADTRYSIESGISGIQLPFDINNEIEFVAVFSDGVTQIDNVDWKDAVVNFMSFKSTAGYFAKRRMIACIKETLKVGKGPFDDISYAVIHITNDLEKGGAS